MDPNSTAVSKITVPVILEQKLRGARRGGSWVGDSLAQVVLGYDSTVPVTVNEMLHHLKAVRRGVRHALLVVDLPYGSYHVNNEKALDSAIRFVKEGGAEAVKFEGGGKRAPLVRTMVEAQIPVVGHIGLPPQS